MNQAEALSRKGDYKGAGRTYEALAAQSPGELRDRFLLRAAREYVRADDTAQATTLLNQVSSSLPRADFALRSLVAAELALRGGRGDKALAELDRIPQPIPREAIAGHSGASRTRAVCIESPGGSGGRGTRARAFALQPRRSARESALDLAGSAEERGEQRGLHSSSGRERGTHRLAGPGTRGVRFRSQSLHCERRHRRLARPLSVASRRTRCITEDVLPELGVGLDYPTQIALILPLSGRQQAAGMAVRDGFLAALLQQDASRRPMLNVYDSAEMGATTAYRRAVTEGAQFVVGPLTKDEVTAIAVRARRRCSRWR